MLITLFGPPGVGKTTVGDWLASEYGFRHYALGRLLRDPVAAARIGLDLDTIDAAIRSGRTIRSPALWRWLNTVLPSSSVPVVVDGYPREPGALGPFNELVRALPAGNRVVALHLTCSPQISAQRMIARGRSDDRPAMPARRLSQYDSVQLPLLSQLGERVKVIEVDGEVDRTVVARKVAALLDLAPAQKV
ncbi:Adenylate kinase [Methylobacterium crusticola]|uniref:Adenylate kinase n=1 Tax=Methylobacterium crusticola TaxID=1697972 RepID=A0ABQ4R0Z2_9HYPH|nr:nucleoside monophosphate kinase [Methylobacterium crusticola]GJD51122.1 Adenylate kinase [Methylobacterium crusticola]